MKIEQKFSSRKLLQRSLSNKSTMAVSSADEQTAQDVQIRNVESEALPNTMVEE